MIELIKVLVERLLGWPVAVLVLCLIFRKPLKSFLERIVLLKAPGVEVSAPTRAEQQLLEAKNSSTVDQLAQPVAAQGSLPIPEGLAERAIAVRNFGGQDRMVLEQIEVIRGELQELQFPLESADTTEVLIRHLAVTQLLVRLERTYRFIFGSQIELLQLANHSGPQEEETARLIFERAKSAAPEFYSGYTFEQWIDFLRKQSLIVAEDPQIAITVYGTQFLSWLVETQSPLKAH